MDKRGQGGLDITFNKMLILILVAIVFFILMKVWSGIGSESLLPQ
ncbi:MAG: hypothetical protein O2779_05155 [Nanoarchaeota archaeon]|nr:hypothetical protein [Nanoarchaeota archaeon]